MRASIIYLSTLFLTCLFPSYALDVISYTIGIKADNIERHLDADVGIFAELSGDDSEIALELSDSLNIRDLTVNSAPTEFRHTRDTLFISVPSMPDAYATFRVQYSGVPPSSSRNGLVRKNINGSSVIFTSSQPHYTKYWLPAHQNPSDKIDTVRMSITTPDTLIAVANGKLIGIDSLSRGIRVHNWITEYPISHYLVFFAVGDYITHDVPIGEGKYIRNYVPSEEYLNRNSPLIDSIGAVYAHFTKHLGNYPFENERYGQILIPMFGGGMENQGISAVSNFSFPLTAHELAHQWFGNSVTCSTWSHIWLHEGFATYLAYLASELCGRDQEAEETLARLLTKALAADCATIFVPPSDFSRLMDYDLTYAKGATAVHMIRRELADDELFFEVLRRYLRENRYGTATTETFFTVLESATQRSWRQFRNQWIHGTGHPEIVWSHTREHDSTIIRLHQTSSCGEGSLFEFDLDIQLIGGASRPIYTVHVDSSHKEYRFAAPEPLTDIVIDPHRNILCSITQDTSSCRPFTAANGLPQIRLFPRKSAHFRGEHAIPAKCYDIRGRSLKRLPASNRSSGLYILQENPPVGDHANR